MVLRRDFVKYGLAALLGASSSGCDEKSDSPYRYRTNAIYSLREDARRFVDYVPKKGYIYDVELNGETVNVNLSRLYFEDRGNLLKYTQGQTEVRVYGNGNIKVWEKGKQVTDQEKIASAQKTTDEVLQKVAQENRKFFKSMLKSTGLPIDPNYFAR